MITGNKLAGQELRTSSEILGGERRTLSILATILFLQTSAPHINVCPSLGQRVPSSDCLVGMSFQIAVQILVVLCLPGASLNFCPTAH